MPEQQHTALFGLHAELGAQMSLCAGYLLPRHYPAGPAQEHLHTRKKASLFDLSHMGQLRLWGPHAAAALESLAPVDAIDLSPGQKRPLFLTSDTGGILGQFTLVHAGDHLLLTINADNKYRDLAYLRRQLGERCRIEILAEQALLSLQGPAAATSLAQLSPETDFTGWNYLSARPLLLCGVECLVSRSGQSGEDGFEISVPASHAERLTRQLLEQPQVALAGLSAYDSLRIEADYCQYGQDIAEQTSLIEAGLGWSVPKVRRVGGAREGGFPGEDRILAELVRGTSRRRVGLLGLERATISAGTPLANLAGQQIGVITSGGFAPSRNSMAAMAYLPEEYTAEGAELLALTGTRPVRMQVAKLPFVPHRHYRG